MKHITSTFCILVIALTISATPLIKVHAEQESSSENEHSSKIENYSEKEHESTHIQKIRHTIKKILKKKHHKSNTSVTPSKNSSPATAPTSTLPSYSLTDVSVHNSQSSCWTIINGNVYDLTKWIAQHPGGEGAILSICGKNGSSAFDNQHGTSGRPEQILKTFQIGIAK